MDAPFKVSCSAKCDVEIIFISWKFQNDCGSHLRKITHIEKITNIYSIVILPGPMYWHMV